MTFPTAEDIEIIDDRSSFGKYNTGRCIIIKTENQKELKQQILSEHEIVERLKAEMESYGNNNLPRMCLLLKSILENKK